MDKVPHQSRRIVEVEYPGSAGRQTDGDPCRMLGGLLPKFGYAELTVVQPDTVAPVAFDQTLNPHEQVGPDRLRAGIAAPDAAEQRCRQEKADGGHDQDAGQEVDLLRPDLDKKEIG